MDNSILSLENIVKLSDNDLNILLVHNVDIQKEVRIGMQDTLAEKDMTSEEKNYIIELLIENYLNPTIQQHTIIQNEISRRNPSPQN